jgi:hypothetical protein
VPGDEDDGVRVLVSTGDDVGIVEREDEGDVSMGVVEGVVNGEDDSITEVTSAGDGVGTIG